MSLRLKDKVLVVTGAAGRIGSEFSLALAQAGAKVVVADVSEEASQSLVNKIVEAGHCAFAINMDITSEASVDLAIQEILKEFGRIDGLVNNAYPRNKQYGANFFDVSYDSFCENVNVHLGGYFLTSQRFAKYFVEQGKGNIVNMASVYGVVAPRFDIYEGTIMTTPVEYAAIKSAVIQLTKYMANLLGPEGVRVNCISPGGILAGQDESFLEKYNAHCHQKGMLNSIDICGSLVFLLSDDSQWMQGQNLIVDDGFTL